ncbi:MAG: bile acid:sodium symporter family protein [Bacteroidales bacterium]
MRTIFRISSIVKIDKFVLALIAVVIIAYLFPQAARDQSGVILNYVSTAGISLIFFFYGLRLSTEKIKLGLKNWKLHILVQSTTFILFPLIVAALFPFVQNEEQEILWLGLFFMAAVPSTVSSSVVMVSMGKGNIPAAIFNASISGIIGIIVTPLLMGLFLQQTGTGFDFTEIYLRLILGIILPVVIGLIMRRKWYSFALRNSNILSKFDKSVILLIVYKSFAGSFNDEVFKIVHITDLLILAAIIILLFFFLFGIVYMISKILRFSREDRITALFCGSQKSLVHGTVFSSVLFAGFHAAGLILVPLMLFHAWQIFIISIIASRYGRRYTNQ